MGTSTAILVPFLIYYLGTRSWWLGKHFGYATQIQMIRDRNNAFRREPTANPSEGGELH